MTSPMLTALLFTTILHAESVNNAAELHARLRAAGARGKSEALAAFPEELKKNFVLMRESRSRQKGTPLLPRAMHFTKSADFVVTSSGHQRADDFAADDLETMELDRESGQWRFATITLTPEGPKEPAYNGRSCIACHGDTPRPIWGSYPAWPGAYGEQDDKMGPAEYAQFLEFTTLARSHEAYRHLDLNKTDWGFYLSGSTYGYPNAVFGDRLGTRHAGALFTRLSSSPRYPRLRHALVATIFDCRDPRLENAILSEYEKAMREDQKFAEKWRDKTPVYASIRVLRLMGLDPYADMRLDRLPRLFDPAFDEQDALYWGVGGDYLSDLLSFLVFHKLWQEDGVLQAQFESARAQIEKTKYLSFDSTNELLDSLDKPETSSDYYHSISPHTRAGAFKPLRDPNAKGEICAHLAAKALGELALSSR